MTLNASPPADDATRHAANVAPAAEPAHRAFSARLPGTLRSVLREPMVHFVALGALLFGLDAALLVKRGDPSRIEIPEAAYQEARALFSSSAKRDPSTQELKVLLDRWVDNEVLYREGLALGLDKGDSAIRDRVIFKSLNVVQAGLNTPPPDEAVLKAWFEANRQRYDIPTRYDFLEAVVTSDRAEDKLRAFVSSLNGKGRSDAESSLNVFRDRPRPSIEQSYGVDFVRALDRAQPGGEWLLLPSSAGLRVVRLTELKPGTRADFDSLKNEVLKDWRSEAMSKLTSQAVRELGSKYRVVRREEGK